MAVNTIDIAERLADAHGLSKTQAKTVVEDVLKGIAEAAAKGEEISLNGFGKFKVQNKPAREGRKSVNRRRDQDCGFEEGRFPAGKGAQGCRKRLIVRMNDDAPRLVAKRCQSGRWSSRLRPSKCS